MIKHEKIKKQHVELQLADFRLLLLQIIFEPLDALSHLMQALEPGENGDELLALKGLFQEIDGPTTHGFDGDFHIPLRAEHDDREVGLELLDFDEDVQAVALA